MISGDFCTDCQKNWLTSALENFKFTIALSPREFNIHFHLQEGFENFLFFEYVVCIGMLENKIHQSIDFA